MSHPKRRDVLKGLTGLGAAAVLAGRGSSGGRDTGNAAGSDTVPDDGSGSPRP